MQFMQVLPDELVTVPMNQLV